MYMFKGWYRFTGVCTCVSRATKHHDRHLHAVAATAATASAAPTTAPTTATKEVTQIYNVATITATSTATFTPIATAAVIASQLRTADCPPLLLVFLRLNILHLPVIAVQIG
jgi:hypothetical protein